MSKVVIIDYGAGNVQSVKFALERLGVKAKLTDNAEIIRGAEKVIFPGVGEARSAMDKIQSSQLHRIIPDLKQPFLGICLGLQLMCKFSEERSTDCLGIFDEEVNFFQIGEKVPHMGWNTVDLRESKLLKGLKDQSTFYFVHSYFVPINDFTVGACTYDIKFSAIMEKDNFYGCQFHPEKSATNGAKILENFIEL